MNAIALLFITAANPYFVFPKVTKVTLVTHGIGTIVQEGLATLVTTSKPTAKAFVVKCDEDCTNHCPPAASLLFVPNGTGIDTQGISIIFRRNILY
ncbi:hypothetical protein [Acanthopleuribacter pedis]|uniref:hypothetical protein n=1 Tax=Acanthopleuribacter pedis TaxID=442870 RepID=UPI001A9FA34F|nr:hypothetical protein [Acanthopleuribacter pedis]